MSTPPDGRGPVVKLTLKRVDLWQLVCADAGLRVAPFTRALGPTLEPLLAAATARRFPANAVLFQQGDAGNSLVFLLKGEVRLMGRQGADVVALGNAHPGDVLGEAEVLAAEPLRATSAVAQTEVDVAEIPREALLERGQLAPRLAAFLEPIRAARHQALSEMTDFLNRW